MTILDEIAAAVLPIIADFAYGGPSWTVYNTSGAGVTGASTLASAGTETIYVLRGGASRVRQGTVGTPLYDADWLAHQELDDTTVVIGGSVITDGTRHFRFLSGWETDMGMKIAPLEATSAPV